jgi:hypothetical protein
MFCAGVCTGGVLSWGSAIRRPSLLGLYLSAVELLEAARRGNIYRDLRYHIQLVVSASTRALRIYTNNNIYMSMDTAGLAF